MKDTIEELVIPYPEGNLLDEHGYPTIEALDYIKNWQIIWDHDSNETKMGHLRNDYQALIDYVKSIWYYDDAINQEDGLVEIHTVGWSGNEEIIEELKKTQFWMMKHQATQTGGHYYFLLGDLFSSKYTYSVEKVENKWCTE